MACSNKLFERLKFFNAHEIMILLPFKYEQKSIMILTNQVLLTVLGSNSLNSSIAFCFQHRIVYLELDPTETKNQLMSKTL